MFTRKTAHQGPDVFDIGLLTSAVTKQELTVGRLESFVCL